MSYGTHSFWDIYLFGLHPICGTVVLVIAFAIFIAGGRDHPERKLFWVATILGTTLLGFVVSEWSREATMLRFIYFTFNTGGTEPAVWEESMVMWGQARMMFMAQAGLAVTFALGLLWWPIRPKGE